MNINESYFVLFSCCIPVNGISESVILDLQRPGYLKIPNLLHNMLIDCQSRIKIGKIKKKYEEISDKEFDKYIFYLVKEEYGFITREPEVFPQLEHKFYSPFEVISSVINYFKESPYSLKEVLNQLIELDTQIIQIRLFGENDIVDLMDSLFVLKRSRVKKVELFLEDNIYDSVLFDDIIQSDGRFELIIYSAKQNLNRDMSINYVLEKILPHSKEIIDESMFVANIPFYMESLRFNVGLNKKICIDLDGSIKNFVNHSKSYGNVVNTKLKDVIAQKQFRWYWYTCNDKIETCKVCQFRYMCLSNSDIIMKDKKLYKKDKCNFDPYLNIWTK